MKMLSNPIKRRKLHIALSLLCALGTVDAVTGGFATDSQAHVAIGGIPPGLSDDYFTGGRMGTVFSTTSRCLELPAPAIDADEKLSEMFAKGEEIFEADFVTDPDAPFGGLGPVYNNVSCRNCHPNYGRARRVESFKDHQFGNGYIAFVHTPDGKFVDGFKFMLQTMATPPYLPPAEDIEITWNKYVDKYANTYPDGSPYNEGKPYEGTLIYPTAKLINPLYDDMPEDYEVSIEGTIGIFGTGLLDAISDQDIIAEYDRQQALDGPIKGKHGRWITEPYDNKKHLGKFTTHNARATLQNGPGFNGSYSVYNITRTDRPSLFASQKWIDKQGELGFDTAVLTAQQPEEMSQTELSELMVWTRGLGVPAARNLDDPIVQKGKKLFTALSCNQCHKPTWTTGPEYEYIPGYANQKIWPYTDLLMHDMGKMNHGLSKIFRTPPLWARQMMKNAVDHTDMWHDLRARDFEETILWHFGEGDAAREAFRHLAKKDRQALIKFLKAI
ncbi:MAG: thiol oxidoreductase [Desulfotalea sp.]|nr:MAG: thiol oxidoreductase [Desulfotalea sp.]